MNTANDGPTIKVLLVGLAGYPSFPGKDLPGAQGDLVLWLDQLTGLGVSDDQIWLATSSPAGPPTADGRALAALAKRLKRGHASTTGRLPAVRAVIEGFVAQLSKTDRALVVWAGHGYTAANQTLHFATAQTDPACQLADMLSWRGVSAVLDKRPAGCELTLVLDTCFAATGPGQRTLAQVRQLRPHLLERARPTDVVFCASLGAQQARELTVHGRTVGAFTWAMTAVLARWGHAADGTGWHITAEELIGRTGALLFSLGIVQNPVADGPVDELERPILFMPVSAQHNNTAPGELPGSEIDPDVGGRVYDMVPTTSGAASLGRLVATTATQALGAVPPGRVWWEVMPGQSFKLQAQPVLVQQAPSVLPSTSKLYGSAQFVQAALPMPSGPGGWTIRSEGLTAANGYAYASAWGLVFVRVGTTPATFGDKATFTWSSALTIPTSTAYWVAVDAPA